MARCRRRRDYVGGAGQGFHADYGRCLGASLLLVSEAADAANVLAACDTRPPRGRGICPCYLAAACRRRVKGSAAAFPGDGSFLRTRREGP